MNTSISSSDKTSVIDDRHIDIIDHNYYNIAESNNIHPRIEYEKNKDKQYLILIILYTCIFLFLVLFITYSLNS